MPRFALSAVLVALALAVPAAARDSWMAYGRHRIPDPTGRHYVVVTARGLGWDGARFELYERAAGAPAATGARDDGPGKPPPPGIEPQEAGSLDGDRALAKGELPHAPLAVHVLSDGGGFVAVERYGGVGYGKSVVAVGPDGAVRFALELADLFDEETRAGFTHSVSSIWWRRGSWIDAEGRALVLVTDEGVRLVDLADGAVREGTEAEILDALASPDGETQQLALDLARERGIAGLEARLAELFEDPARPLGVRLRAAVALAASGDRRGAELALAVARDRGAGAERAFAVRHLPALLPPEESIEALRAVLDGSTDAAWWPAIEAFADLGVVAVPALVGLLGDREAKPDARVAAAHALARIGTPAALKPLLSAVEEGRADLAAAALEAALATGGESVAGRLAGILRVGSTQDLRIATWFAEVRHPDAPAALRAALARHAAGTPEERAIRAALAFQEDPSTGGGAEGG